MGDGGISDRAIASAMHDVGELGRALSIRLERAELLRRLFSTTTQPIQLGRYQIVRELGAGGMGCVYLADDPQLQRQVAIKTLAPHAAASLRPRMSREARAMALVNHPNVVPVFDVGLWAEGLFVAMAYVPGPSLKDWLSAKPRTAAEIVRVFCDAGRGLVAIHEAGLLHRDFKPANVIVGDDGVARVVDFGLTALVREHDARRREG